MAAAEPFLDADLLRAATFVRHVELHDEILSTNDRALILARQDGLALPALVVARQQTGGRGRGRKHWWSADGALTYSLLLDPIAVGVAPARWPQLSLAAGVAVCDALMPFAPRADIGVKWPNDVFVDQRKVCGILIESPAGGLPAKGRLVVGIGVNVNNSWDAAPQEAGNGVALCDITGRRHELQAVLIGLLGAFAKRFEQLRDHAAELPRAWQRLDLLAGKSVVLDSERGRIAGPCRGIAADGALVIETPDGQKAFYSGTAKGR